MLTSSSQADGSLCPAQNIPLAKFVPSANDRWDIWVLLPQNGAS
jgi:hypothetical protein